MYKERVSKLVMLDAIHFLPVSADTVYAEYRVCFSRYFKNLSHKNKTPPMYTREEAIERMRDARFSPIREDSAEILMERSLRPAGDGKFHITSAQHLKYVLRPPMSLSYHKEVLKKYPICCPHLIILAKDSLVGKKVDKDLFKILKKNKNFRSKWVEGQHDVHLEDPDIVAPLISTFLLRQNSKL